MADRSEACPACDGRNIARRAALIAPFIAAYVLDEEPPPPCEVCRCAACGLVFFARPYSEAEVARLYADYRGERYLSVRHRFEPWYSRRFNADIGGEAGMTPRREMLRRTLAGHEQAVRTVLDYAGDRGQIMQGGPGEEHFVFEISGATPEAGVTAIADSAALEGRVFDLVLLCGAVEHFSWPLDQVTAIARHVRPGGLMYIEVPDEAFAIGPIPRGAWYGRYLGFIARRPIVRMALDFYSTAARIKLRTVPPLGFVKQHEHLNVFTVASLSALVERAGLALVSCGLGAGSVVALCRRPES